MDWNDDFDDESGEIQDDEDDKNEPDGWHYTQPLIGSFNYKNEFF